MTQLLHGVYPEYDWLPWKFINSPKNMWKDEKTVNKLIDWSGKQLGIKNLSDWNNVSIKVIFPPNTIKIEGNRFIATSSQCIAITSSS
jgi:hypothetical protein